MLIQENGLVREKVMGGGVSPHPRSYVPTPFIQIMQDNFNEEWSFLRNKEKFF